MNLRRLSAMICAVAVLVVAVPASAPVHAARCTVSRDADGFPVWSSGCSDTVAPGRFGPLRMGRTTVSEAKKSSYLAYNRFCSRWDGVGAGRHWSQKKGRLLAWSGGAITTRKLRPDDSLSKARAKYPDLKATGFMVNDFIEGEGWNIYSTKSKLGWLDIYRYNTTESENRNFFAVRAKSVTRPILTYIQDGC